MRVSLRRQFLFLRVYAIATSLGVLVLAAAAVRQAGTPQNLGEIKVERINVVDANGTLRMVISNKDRMHPGVFDGKMIDRPRPVAGMIFFNDEGDEAGGLAYTGQERDGVRHADAGIMFDQLKQDQTIGFSYTESNGRRTAGLQVWDRSESLHSALVERLNAANAIAEQAERDKALAAVRATAPPGPRRVFVGKNGDRAALVSLADEQGRPRLVLTVDPAGNPRIEFLDESGTVVTRVPEK
jgi:hypothetical protein